MKRFLQFSILYLLLLLISGVVAMGQNYFWDTFDNPPNLTNWVVDRYEPEKFEKAFFDGDNRLHLEINVSDAYPGRSASYSTNFYNTQGRKIYVNNSFPVIVRGDLYVATDWDTKHRRSDLWVSTWDGTTITDYPIIGFANTDGNTPTFRVYDSPSGVWIPITMVINYGSWYSFEAHFIGTDIFYYINGTLVHTDSDVTGGSAVKEVFVQGYNFGNSALPAAQQAYETYDIYWDNVATYPSNSPIVFNLTQNTSYNTIQAAVNAANANDHLYAMPGTYPERVVIDKSLTLEGADESTVILDGTGLGTGSGIYINNGIQNVLIRYLTVQNYSGTGPNGYGGIYAVGGNDNITVKNCTIKNNVGCSGFYANGPIDNVLIDGITVSGHPNTFGAARGIVIWNGLKSNITIKNCEVFNNNCCGIELQDGTASGVTLLNNNIYDNGDNGIGIVGLQGPGENLVSGNTLLNNGRFGIEIKNPNGSGNATGAGRIVVENNNVSRTSTIVDQRDIVGIAAFRRGVLAGNVDVPTGAVIRNNTLSGYVQASNSDGFGIVVEGINHSVTGNTVSGCDVGIQMQAGHTPYPGDGDQSNLTDLLFGRGNSPIACGITISGNTFATNGTDTRYIGATAGSGFVMNTNTGEIFCSIQSAIDDAQTLNGHALQVSAGTYTENLTINKSLEIRGANYGISAGYTPGTRGAESIILGQATVSAVGVKFDGLEFDSPVAATTTLVQPTTNGLTILFQNNVFDMKNQKSSAIYNDAKSSTSFTILNNKFKNQFYSGTYSARVIYAKDTYCNITGNDFSNIEIGVYLVGTNTTDATIVEGNRFSVTSAAVLVGYRQGIRIIGNDFALGGAIYGDKASNLTIENNNFGAGVSYAGKFIASCGSGIVMNNNSILSTLFNLSPNIIDASCNWWGTTDACVLIPKISGNVNFLPYLTNGSDNSGATGFQPVPGSCNGNEGVVKNLNTGKYYCRIQAAIDDPLTVNGHTIQASTGLYDEDVNINKSLTLIAGSTPVIDGKVLMSANNSTIDGYTIQNWPITSNFESSGILVTASNIVIKNNIIKNATGNAGCSMKGIQVWQDNSTPISNIQILSNKIDNLNNISSKGVYGVMIQGNVSNVLIQYNTLTNMTSAGWTVATEISYSSGVTNSPFDVRVLHNMFNTINGAALNVDVNSSSNPPNATTIKVNYNSFLNVPLGISSRVTTQILDGQYNWWGNCSGPSSYTDNLPTPCTSTAAGTGAMVSCYVDYTPWLGGGSFYSPALWLTPTTVIGDPDIAVWPGIDCGAPSLDATMASGNKQPSYVNNGVRFVSDYGDTKYGYSDMMEVVWDKDVTTNNNDKWNPSNGPKNLFVVFKTGSSVDPYGGANPAYYRDGRQTLCEFGGPLSGYGLYIMNGKVAFGMWNRFESKFLVYDPPANSSISTLNPNTKYIAQLEYESGSFTAMITDGTLSASSSSFTFAGISQDGATGSEDKSGIGGATRTRYHDYSTGETYSDEFDGILGDVIVYNSLLGTTENNAVVQYLTNRYLNGTMGNAKRSDGDWKVYQQYDFTGDNAVSTAYPNPFSATTSFGVNLTSDMNVTIELIDATGRSVQSIYRGQLNKGIHDFTINGESLPNGMYFYRVLGDGFSLMGKAVLNK